MKPHRLVLLAVTGASMFAFTGCAPVGDDAIKVDGTTFSSKDVDLFTDLQCNAAKKSAADPTSTGQVQKISRAQMRSQSASYLVTAALEKRIAKAAGVKASAAQVRTSLTQFKAVITESASSADRQQLTSILSELIAGDMELQQAAIKAIGEDVLTQMAQAQAQSAVQAKAQELVTAAAAKATTDIDPALGLSKDGLGPDASGGSLSAPVSTFAKASSSISGDGAWMSAIQPAQRCT